MAQSKQKLKTRIRSIKSTKKITQAMNLIANSKLLKMRSRMEKNREYAGVLLDTLQAILADNKDMDNPYLKKKSSTKTLTIVFSSDLGLCGGYNSNMLKFAEENIACDEPVMVIGNKGRGWLSSRGYNIINEYINSDDLDYAESAKLMNRAIDMYLNNEIGRIQVIYTRFKNTITFIPQCKTLIPVDMTEGKREKSDQETIFEPGAEEVCNQLIPMALKAVLYSLWLETKTSEQASRRAAMESATDNAEELEDKFTLQYNQARQAAITQEITEIVAGADSL